LTFSFHLSLPCIHMADDGEEFDSLLGQEEEGATEKEYGEEGNETKATDSAGRTSVALACLLLFVILGMIALFHANKSTEDVIEEANEPPSSRPFRQQGDLKAPTQTPTTSSSPVTSSTTESPTISPTASPSETSIDYQPWEVPHLPFENLEQYRRVCSTIHSSLLCMNLRFPWPVPLQDPDYDYAHPVDERLLTLQAETFYVDGDLLDECNSARSCLDQNPLEDQVVVVWTKGPSLEDQQLFGTHSHRDLYHQYFDNHVILVLGASPSPGISQRLATLLDDCSHKGHSARRSDSLCHRRYLWPTYADIPNNFTFVGAPGYYPLDIDHGVTHGLPQPLIDVLVDAAHLSTLVEHRKLSLLFEWPIAHAQNQDMIEHDWDLIVEIQGSLAAQVEYIQSEAGQEELLARTNYSLGHVLAFDGLPQFFPTATHAYPFEMKHLRNSSQLEPFDWWQPEYGTECRGPVPPTSRLTAVNQLARDFMVNQTHLRTWEMSNQFWFTTTGWGDKGLDCTHAKNAGSGLYSSHKYALAAYIEDYYAFGPDTSN